MGVGLCFVCISDNFTAAAPLLFVVVRTGIILLTKK